MTLKFTVLGEPQGKARARIVRLSNGASHSFTPEKTVLYENLIQFEYQRQCGAVRFGDDERLNMSVSAYFGTPASASKKKISQMLNGTIRPAKKPDWDNIEKVVADVLNGVAYRDDMQIVDCMVSKYYSANPRVEVTISAVTVNKRQNSDGGRNTCET
jgi:Holliday junction resolvase RusA-like endonuclease